MAIPGQAVEEAAAAGEEVVEAVAEAAVEGAEVVADKK